MSLLLSGILLACFQTQDTAYDLLIDRLRWNDPKDREQAAAKLASAGADMAPHLERALAKAKDPTVIARIEQVKARIRLKLHTAAIDDGFSKSFKGAAPELVNSLRHPNPEVLLKAVEAVTGYTGTRGVRGFRPLQGEKIEAASRSDALLVFRIVLSVLPPLQQPEEEWALITAAMSATAHQFKTATLHEDCLYHLDTPDSEFRRVILEMSEVGHRRRFVPAYLKMLEGHPAQIRGHAAMKLTQMNPGEFAPDIAAMVDRTEGRTRGDLIRCLSRTGDPQWKTLFLKYAEHSDPLAQGEAVSALALMDPAAAVPHLLRLLDSAESQGRLAGIRAAHGHSDPRVTQALERIIFKSPDAMAGNQAVYALCVCNPGNLAEVLIKAMKHESHLVRNAAAVTADWVGGDEIVRALKALLEDPEGPVRTNARKSLGQLKAEGFEVKEPAKSLLVDLDDPACLSVLLDCLEGPNEQAAIDGLMRLRSAQTYQSLLELGLPWPKDRNPTVKEALEAAATAMKSKGVGLTLSLAPCDEKPFIRRNSNRMVVASLYWLVSATLGHEYGWILDEKTLSLVPIDDARRLWREWALKRTERK